MQQRFSSLLFAPPDFRIQDSQDARLRSSTSDTSHSVFSCFLIGQPFGLCARAATPPTITRPQIPQPTTEAGNTGEPRQMMMLVVQTGFALAESNDPCRLYIEKFCSLSQSHFSESCEWFGGLSDNYVFCIHITFST